MFFLFVYFSFACNMFENVCKNLEYARIFKVCCDALFTEINGRIKCHFMNSFFPQKVT